MCFAQEGWNSLELQCKDDLHDVFLLNDSVGWAYSYGTGLVLKTNNSGSTWKIICHLDSVFYEQIQFVSPEVGWLCGGDGQLRKSTDGGCTWLKVTIPRPTDVDLALLYAMYFKNESNGFLAGGYLKYRESEGRKYVDWDKGSYFIFQTTDAGKSWSQIVSPLSTLLFNFQFPNDSIGFVSGNNVIYRTSDCGKKWQVSFLDTNKIIGGIRAMYFVDAQKGYAASWNGYFLRTTDGGFHWETTNISKNHLRSMCFANKTIGYIVGNADETSSPMYMTQDSGKTWESILHGYPDLHRIRKSDTILWACGKNGTIIKKHLE
jgi:photosystem II stability/assembly factor-like uncharacterized protein